MFLDFWNKVIDFLVIFAAANILILINVLLVQAAFESEEAYYKTIGYREEDGKIESLENYLSRLKSYMRLYAALIQVCRS